MKFLPQWHVLPYQLYTGIGYSSGMVLNDCHSARKLNKQIVYITGKVGKNNDKSNEGKYKQKYIKSISDITQVGVVLTWSLMTPLYCQNVSNATEENKLL